MQATVDACFLSFTKLSIADRPFEVSRRTQVLYLL